MEPLRARKVFPCFDEPAMKATFNVTLVHDPRLIALSNMPIYQSEVKDGWRHDHFKRTVNMSTYLAAFAVGDFKYKETTTDNGIKVRILTVFDGFFCKAVPFSSPFTVVRPAHIFAFSKKRYEIGNELVKHAFTWWFIFLSFFFSLFLAEFNTDIIFSSSIAAVTVIWVSPCFGRYPRTQIPSDMGIPFQNGGRVLGIPRYPPHVPKSLVIWVPLKTCRQNFAGNIENT